MVHCDQDVSFGRRDQMADKRQKTARASTQSRMPAECATMAPRQPEGIYPIWRGRPLAFSP